MRLLLLILPALLFGLSDLSAWGGAHIKMTEAAFRVQPKAFRELWSQTHQDPFEEKEKPIAWLLAHRYTMHPDAVDGPCRNESDIPRRLHATKFVFGQRTGKFMPPIAYSDPEKASKGLRPNTYHYFTLKTEELNRIFAEKGAIRFDRFPVRSFHTIFDRILVEPEPVLIR